MLKIQAFICWFVFVCSVWGQINIENNENYYVGIGESSNQEQARSYALSNLIQKIQVFIGSNSERVITEKNENFSDSISVKTVANSFLVLTDLEEKIEKYNNGTYKITKYVKKDVVYNLFNSRNLTIKNYLNQAELELNTSNPKINLEEVLKNYYWAYLLSVVTPDTLTYSFNYDKTKTPIITKGIASTAVNAINYIISKINFNFIKRIESDNITFKYIVTYFNKPIENLSYTYFDGVGEMLGEVKNGETVLDFYFKQDKNIVDKEFAVNFEIAKEDIMDELLNAVHNIKKGKILNLSIKYGFGGVVTETKNKTNVIETPKTVTNEITKAPLVTETKETKPLLNKFYEPKPRIIDNLIEKSNDAKQFLKYINELEKRNVIVTGNKNSFETIDNLYAVVVTNEEIAALIKHQKGECYDYLQNKIYEIKYFNGNKILWFEILR